jgi:hypothetical protein
MTRKRQHGKCRRTDFGTLLYAGHDWADPALARRSKVLMAEQVMPRINAAIGGAQRAAE